ncbi:DUF2846 domain-containing protein [Burkholderia stagnalis]
MIGMCRAWLFAAGVTLLASGCASGPQYSEAAKSIPPLASDHGRIYFYRTNMVFGAAIQPQIKLNDEAVGRSQLGSFFYVDKLPGNYKVTTTTETEEAVTFKLDAGETKYVRTYATMGVLVYRVVPSLEDEAVGMGRIRELKYSVDNTPADQQRGSRLK